MTRDDVRLGIGRHRHPDEGMCAVEYAAWVRGAPFGDGAPDASPVAAGFLRCWNDGLDDPARQELKRYALRLPLASPDAGAEERRMRRVAEWLTEDCCAAWLRCAGMEGHAARLRARASGGPDAARDTLVEILRAVGRPEPATWHDGAELETAVRSALHASGTAAAWAAYRDASWAAGDTFGLPGAARQAAWYGWLLGWRALRVALMRDPAPVAGTTAALRESAFALLDEITAPAP